MKSFSPKSASVKNNQPESLGNSEVRDHSELNNLRIYARRLETLLKNLPGMSYRCLNHTFWPMDFVSSGCYELSGYHRHEIESQEILWGQFTHPDDVDAVDYLVRSAAKQGVPFEVEYRIITKDGVEKWVWERGRQVDQTEDGIGILEGFITDITRIKKSEAELINAKAYADAIVESAGEGIITIDALGYIESMNHAAQVMFDYELEDVLEKHSRLLMVQKYHHEIEQFLKQINDKKFKEKLSLEIYGTRRNGAQFPAQITISRIDNSLTDKFVILMRDLTVRRAAEREAREHRETLAHADRLNTLGEMAAAIAHEINQPLTAISMYSKSALKFLSSSDKNDRVEDALNRLSAQAQRAGVVMEKMQAMTTRRNSVQDVVDLNQLMNEVYKLAQPLATVRDFTIVLDLEDDLPCVVCDSIQIQQVILNLLRNGMDSMETAKRLKNSEIYLRAESLGNEIKISIDDCGLGISNDMKEQIYMPFISTKESGMGLGLSISRSIISSHGSKLDYVNNDRDGATFFFSLIGHDHNVKDG